MGKLSWIVTRMNGDTPLPYREVSTLDYKKKTVYHGAQQALLCIYGIFWFSPQTSQTNADLMVMRP